LAPVPENVLLHPYSVLQHPLGAWARQLLGCVCACGAAHNSSAQPPVQNTGRQSYNRLQSRATGDSNNPTATAGFWITGSAGVHLLVAWVWRTATIRVTAPLCFVIASFHSRLLHRGADSVQTRYLNVTSTRAVTA